MKNDFIYTLIHDDGDEFLNRAEYEEVVADAIKDLMQNGFTAGEKMDDLLSKDSTVNLPDLLYGNEKERKKAVKAVEEAFREEAEDSILSDGWVAVPLTFHNFVDIFRELGADTVNALVAEAFG